MGYKVTAEPAAEPVTLNECKLVARLSASGLDTMIETIYIPAARRMCEQRTGRSLITQTVDKVLDAWPTDGDIRLDYGPVQTVSEITYLDADGVAQVVDGAIYSLDNADALRPAFVVLASGQVWPSAGTFANAITVTYVAGYGDTSDDVPRELRLWIMAAVAEMVRSGSPDVKVGFAAGLLDREAMPAV